MLEVQRLYKPTPPHQPTAKRRRLRLTSVPLVDLRAPQGGGTLEGVDLYGSLSSQPKSIMSDVDSVSLSNKSGICSISDGMDNHRIQGSCRIRHLNSSWETESRFPKLNECAHFHYEFVELRQIDVRLYNKESRDNCKPLTNGEVEHRENFSVQVSSNGKSWVLQRSYENFRMLDRQLHQCVYDRKFSALPEILPSENEVYEKENSYDGEGDANSRQQIEAAKCTVAVTLSQYLRRFSDIAGSLISCGPILNWLELDNRGNRLIVADDSAINTPAVAAAYVTKRYISQANDEISFEVGDMISVIDMPPSDESIWWRGKRGFEVGFFPSECVEVIGDKVPHTIHIPKAPTKPVLRKHGKLIAFFRSFILSRPSRRKLKQCGILRERVFGCDLGEHLLNSGHDMPMVLKCCADFIEAHGIVDGIYRLSGVTSNIQKLRNTFDEDRIPNLTDEAILQDIHSVASLLKMYFRELPNPLLTYQLYDKFVSAVQSDEEIRLLNVRDIVQQMPPPHYRTLEYLIKHLACVAAHGSGTGMTPKNLAIVWAPNLLRSKDLELGGVAALQVVGVQAVVTEFLIHYSDLIFSDKLPVFAPILGAMAGSLKRNRPKSLAISTPTKLLSLEEARSRALGTMPGCHFSQQFIEVGGGPATLPSRYHTIINLPDRKRSSSKNKKSPSGWKSFFSSKGRSSSQSSRDGGKNYQNESTTPTDPLLSLMLMDEVVTEVHMSRNTNCLRSVKSAESLISVCAAGSHHNSNVQDGSIGILTSSSDIGSPSLFVVADDGTAQKTSSLGTVQPALQRHSPHSHHRSVSHDSYFEFSLDHRQENRPPAELGTILSEDNEDGTTAVQSSIDHAVICFADQEREPDGNDLSGVIAKYSFDANGSDINDTLIYTHRPLSIDFEDVPCDIVGDIQREMAAALHWDKDALTKNDATENSSNDNSAEISMAIMGPTTDIAVREKPIGNAVTPEGVAYHSNCSHSLDLETCLNYPRISDNTAPESDETHSAVNNKFQHYGNFFDVISPSTSFIEIPLDMLDILDNATCVPVLKVPCSSVQIEAVRVPSMNFQENKQHSLDQLCGGSGLHNAVDVNNGDLTATEEEAVPKMHIWAPPVNPDTDDVEVLVQPFQVDNLILGGGLDSLLCGSELTESYANVSHNVLSLGTSSSSSSSSAASSIIEELCDPFAYSVLRNEEGTITPLVREKSPTTMVFKCDETKFDETKFDVVNSNSPDKCVASCSSKSGAHEENKQNDALLTGDVTSIHATTLTLDVCVKSDPPCVTLASKSLCSISSSSPSTFLSTFISRDLVTTGSPRYALVPDKVSPVEESKRKFESEIGRDILRERKMKLEFERIQLETQCRAVETPVTWDLSTQLEDNVRASRESSVNVECVESSLKAESSRMAVGPDTNNDLHDLKDFKWSPEPTFAPYMEKVALEQKEFIESTMQSHNLCKAGRPERKASVRELMSRFERGKSCIPRDSKQFVDVLDVAKPDIDDKPICKSSGSSVAPLNDNTLSTPMSIMSIDVCGNSGELPLSSGGKPLEVYFGNHDQLSKSALGKLETYVSELPNRKSDDTCSPIIFSPLLTSKALSSNEAFLSSDPARRKRIDRYKEERRAQLREKIRAESFKNEQGGHSDYLIKLKQIAVSPTKQIDDVTVKAEDIGSFSSRSRHSRLSTGSPLDDKAKADGFITRRRSVNVQQHSGESIVSTEVSVPVTLQKTLTKVVTDALSASVPASHKIVSLVEGNSTKEPTELPRQTSQLSNEPTNLPLDHCKVLSLHKVNSLPNESLFVDCVTKKMKSGKDNVQRPVTNSQPIPIEDIGLKSPSLPARKIKDVAALFEQPGVVMQRQFSQEGLKITKSKVSAPASSKASYPSSS